MSSKEIWENLTKHEVDNRDVDAITHTRNRKNEKGEWYEEQYQLHYYNWSKCWRELMNRYPDASYTFCTFEREGKLYDCMYYADSSASVHCQVTINGVTREMWLAVMDYNNKAVKNPSAVDVSNAKMRCLVKTIAMFGLGLDIYEGRYDPEKQSDGYIRSKKFAGFEDENGNPIFDVIDHKGRKVSSFDNVESWIQFMSRDMNKELTRMADNQIVAEQISDYILRLTDNLTGIPVPDEYKKKLLGDLEQLFGKAA
jgi:hypothetical protein|tara:strand:- start:833 stop:1597 length:765 start_codon:yes stop_codon:yes gene_type:complete